MNVNVYFETEVLTWQETEGKPLVLPNNPEASHQPCLSMCLWFHYSKEMIKHCDANVSVTLISESWSRWRSAPVTSLFSAKTDTIVWYCLFRILSAICYLFKRLKCNVADFHWPFSSTNVSWFFYVNKFLSLQNGVTFEPLCCAFDANQRVQIELHRLRRPKSSYRLQWHVRASWKRWTNSITLPIKIYYNHPNF